MDSKRKSGGGVGAGDSIDDRGAKRRKLPNDNIDLSEGETAETTTNHGLKLLEIVRKTEDKSGRLVATEFLTLPSKRSLPDYYQITRMPIALDDVEKKLKRGEFPTLTTLESYLKRMVQNAKEYNQKGSQVYDDAERVRKAVSNHMVKINPAYKIGGYTAFPTPVPDGNEESTNGADADEEPDNNVSKKKTRPSKSLSRRRSSVSPAPPESVAPVGYEGLTFQQAQEKIMEDLLNEKEQSDDDFLAFADFIELPPRSLKDYYRTIKNPISLHGLQKRVNGTGRKTDVAGVSEFRSWAAFEEEASNLWKNAFFYNEDGSEISLRATKLQESFKKYLKKARLAVPDPVAPKIKLKLADVPAPTPKFTLKIAGKASPVVTPSPHTNGSSSVAAANGTSRQNPFSAPSSTPVALEQLDKASSASGSVASPSPSLVAPVKNEEAARTSPALVASNGLRTASQASSTPVVANSVMAPPSTPGLSNLNTYSSAGFAQSFPQPQYQQPNLVLESKWRQPGQDASNAMITNLGIATHPGLNITNHFRMDVPPSPTMTQQSLTINLPPTHFFIQIKPVISASLLERQHKVFVTCGSRLHQLPLPQNQAIDHRKSLYETRLNPGINRIEVEIIAALPKEARAVNGQDYETEKITVFANLLKA